MYIVDDVNHHRSICNYSNVDINMIIIWCYIWWYYDALNDKTMMQKRVSSRRNYVFWYVEPLEIVSRFGAFAGRSSNARQLPLFARRLPQLYTCVCKRAMYLWLWICTCDAQLHHTMWLPGRTHHSCIMAFVSAQIMHHNCIMMLDNMHHNLGFVSWNACFLGFSGVARHRWTGTLDLGCNVSLLWCKLRLLNMGMCASWFQLAMWNLRARICQAWARTMGRLAS